MYNYCIINKKKITSLVMAGNTNTVTGNTVTHKRAKATAISAIIQYKK